MKSMMRNSLLLLLLLIVSLSCLNKKKSPLEFGWQVIHQNIEHRILGKYDYQEAKNIAKSKKDIIYSLLEPKFDPYTGDNSIHRVCRKKNLPKDFLKEDGTGFSQVLSLYSSQSRVIGECLNPEKVLKTQYLLIYCGPSNTLHLVRYFYKKNDPWLAKPVAKCN